MNSDIYSVLPSGSSSATVETQNENQARSTEAEAVPPGAHQRMKQISLLENANSKGYIRLIVVNWEAGEQI